MAALSPEAIVAALAPKLASDPRLATFLEMAEQRTSQVRDTGWSVDKRAHAVAYRALHMLVLSNTRPLGEAGSIQAKREGRLSLNFSQQARTARGISVDPDLEQTQFGRQLIGLIKGTFVPISLAGDTATDTDWDAALWGEDI